MKRLILLTALISLPAYALCPIEGDAVCSIPEVKKPFNSMFMNNSNNINTNSETNKLQPKTKENPLDNMRGQNNKLNNSSTCAFGNCLNDTTTSKRLRSTHP